MKIVVTGGSGLIGEYVVKELEKFDHEVIVFDIIESKNKKVDFIKADMLKIDDCRKALKGADVIIHLAAIPNPFNDPLEKIMYENVVGTSNIYIAASELGIKKVVHASTDSIYGFWFREREFLPSYLPLDEKHPLNTQNLYGLSKKIDEEIAANFVRSHDINSISIRIPFITVPGTRVPFMIYYKIPSYKNFRNDHKVLKNGFWVYCDARDAAQGFRLAAEGKNLKKHEVFCICADDNITESDSVDLVRRYWSEKIPFAKDVTGRRSLMDNSKAKAWLGFQPQYTLKNVITD